MKKTVLVVDDSATVRKFVATSLQIQGFGTVMAADGMEALERMPNEQIDAVVTDLNMPDMDGFEFIRNLRSMSEYASIPIIVLSSITNQEDKETAAKLGVVAYLEKPFSSARIQRVIAQCLSMNWNQTPTSAEESYH